MSTLPTSRPVCTAVERDDLYSLALDQLVRERTGHLGNQPAPAPPPESKRRKRLCLCPTCLLPISKFDQVAVTYDEAGEMVLFHSACSD